jgi:Skp family chaperone for outer membrane proteins
MTIDERLERLTDRHEALAQSLELLRDSVHEMRESLEAERAARQEVEARERQLRDALLRSIAAFIQGLGGLGEEGTE